MKGNVDISKSLNTGADGDFNKSRITGVYRGRVEDTNDPKQLGRVRIRVPKLHGIPGGKGKCFEIKDLPWAVPCFMGAGYDYGSFMVPEVGEFAFVVFESGYRNKPVYIGASYGEGPKEPKIFGSIDGSEGESWYGPVETLETPEEAQKDIPKVRILYKSHKGHKIILDDSEGEEKLLIWDWKKQYALFQDDVVKIQGNKKIKIFCEDNSEEREKTEDKSKDPNDKRVKIELDGTSSTYEMSARHVKLLDGDDMYIVNRDIMVSSEDLKIENKNDVEIISGKNIVIKAGEVLKLQAGVKIILEAPEVVTNAGLTIINSDVVVNGSMSVML